MLTVSTWFLRLSVVYATIGTAMSIAMGITHDFRLAPAHEHLNLLGWVTMALAGLYYRAVPAATESALAGLHLIVANLGMILLLGALLVLPLGYEPALPAAAIGSLLLFAATGLFAAIVFHTTGRSAG